MLFVVILVEDLRCYVLLKVTIITGPLESKNNFRNDDKKLKLAYNRQRGVQMEKLHLIQIVILLLTMVTLSGCFMVPAGFHGGGHGNGHQKDNHNHSNHD